MSTGRRKVHTRYVVPDFKAIHAGQEAKLAARREKNAPLVPIPLQLNTEERARSRQKFDEMMKEKEKEVERALEERRRQREAEEEQEIREIRRKAVPKAHEIPEWYTNAPRRKGQDIGNGD